jgi:hypothetical protein
VVADVGGLALLVCCMRQAFPMMISVGGMRSISRGHHADLGAPLRRAHRESEKRAWHTPTTGGCQRLERAVGWAVQAA